MAKGPAGVASSGHALSRRPAKCASRSACAGLKVPGPDGVVRAGGERHRAVRIECRRLNGSGIAADSPPGPADAGPHLLRHRPNVSLDARAHERPAQFGELDRLVTQPVRSGGVRRRSAESPSLEKCGTRISDEHWGSNRHCQPDRQHREHAVTIGGSMNRREDNLHAKLKRRLRAHDAYSFPIVRRLAKKIHTAAFRRGCRSIDILTLRSIGRDPHLGYAVLMSSRTSSAIFSARLRDLRTVLLSIPILSAVSRKGRKRVSTHFSRFSH